MKYEDLTDRIIGAFFKVYNTLGYGFLESVYEKALAIELQNQGLNCITQKHIEVFYNESPVGHYRTDIIVDEKVILEIKAVEEIVQAHESQLINYLKATRMEVGLILNFGPSPKIKRKVFTR